MAEVLEVDEAPMASNGNSGEKSKQSKSGNDKHIPGFSFESYPQFDDDPNNSPRLPNDYWNKFEQQSKEVGGATKLRHDSNLLDQMI